MFFLSRINPSILIAGAVAYIGLNLFLCFSLARFTGIQSAVGRRALFALVLLLSFSFLLEAFVPRSAPAGLRDGIYALFGAWTSAFALLLGAAIVLWALAWIRDSLGLRLPLTPIAWVLLTLPFLVTAYGAWQGAQLRITEITVPVKRLPIYWRDKVLVHVTDLHLRGPDQVRYVEEIARRIGRIAPELVVLTGDLFDVRSRDHARDLLAPLGRLSCPVLFVTGNHDRYFASRTDLTDLGPGNLTLLDGTRYEREGLQIIGLGYPGGPDSGNPATVLRDKIPFDREKPAILLYHTPTTVDADEMGDRYISPNTDFSIVKGMGIDLQLSGHTHGGQFFPLSLVTHFLYHGYEKGLHRDGDFSLFVSSGLGTWGPPLRIFVPPEIAVIHLEQGSG